MGETIAPRGEPIRQGITKSSKRKRKTTKNGQQVVGRGEIWAQKMTKVRLVVMIQNLPNRKNKEQGLPQIKRVCPKKDELIIRRIRELLYPESDPKRVASKAI